ncbi:putative GNAT family acetyltransferase [Aspergillus bombycis]|uniref:Putative GNAT family acetyltransferase n=1 Tax=Aspergillus bombycis TaxID=109264 RepID=A0A1F8A100_9EURO|nr:putative GNAT family acetyltransferase [Aspergillus bombycis]OGM45373.1 putative GNAT family acetyltransferase [Aspergillus bombycis]
MTTIIRPAAPDEIPAIIDFIMAARADMFSMLDPSLHLQKAQRELATFQQSYLEHPNGAFFTARVDGRLVGTVGYVTYDQRFPQLDFGEERVVEVLRMYVHPDCRRTGLASKLYTALEQRAGQAGIQRMYLHTHPFLPGSISFWEQQGFSVLHVDDDPVWRTTHMSRLPAAGER